MKEKEMRECDVFGTFLPYTYVCTHVPRKEKRRKYLAKYVQGRLHVRGRSELLTPVHHSIFSTSINQYEGILKPIPVFFTVHKKVR